MSFPGHEQSNPQRVSAAVHTAGFAQDVVVATSRLIHDQPLTDRDRQALAECRGLLEHIASTDISFARTGERQLAATNTVALLRKARGAGAQASADVTKVIEAIDRLLSGERDEEAVREMRRLRETFLSLGEANLAAMTQRDDQGHEGPDGWTRLITSSPS